jgi:hypothetical protein
VCTEVVGLRKSRASELGKARLGQYLQELARWKESLPIFEHPVATYPNNVQHRSGLMQGYYHAEKAKLPGTRRELFESLDQPALKPLPLSPL